MNSISIYLILSKKTPIQWKKEPLHAANVVPSSFTKKLSSFPSMPVPFQPAVKAGQPYHYNPSLQSHVHACCNELERSSGHGNARIHTSRSTSHRRANTRDRSSRATISPRLFIIKVLKLGVSFRLLAEFRKSVFLNSISISIKVQKRKRYIPQLNLRPPTTYFHPHYTSYNYCKAIQYHA
jgi:hypothetical protein